ncbi:MAG: hypothetical protein WA117_17860 [Verrucomicrobiia bacterium]
MSDTPGRNFAEFFAGIGLMRMGLELAGWQMAILARKCYSDLDKQ